MKKLEPFELKVTTRSDLFYNNNIKDLESSLKKPERTSLLNTAINTGYYFFMFPFQLAKDGQLVKKRWQRIICGAVYILALHRYGIEILEFPFERLSSGAVDYFLLFQKVLSPVSCLIFFKSFWLHEERFQKVAEFIYNSKTLHMKKTWLTSNAFIATTIIHRVVQGLLILILGIRITHELSYKNPEWFYRRYVAEARFTLSLSREANLLRNTPPLVEDITLWDQITTAFVSLGIAARAIIGQSRQPMVLVAGITLWQPVMGFYDQIKEDIDRLKISKNAVKIEYVNFILKQYEELKELSELIKDAVEGTILTHMIEETVYLSIHMNAVFVGVDWFRKLREGFGYVAHIMTFTIFSEICSKMQVMKMWLSNEKIKPLISCSSMTLLLDELSNHPVAISGGVFKITYQLSITLLSTAVTYFIICSQIGQTTDTE